MTSEELKVYPEYQEFEKRFQVKKAKKKASEFKPQGIINYYLPGETVKLI